MTKGKVSLFLTLHFSSPFSLSHPAPCISSLTQSPFLSVVLGPWPCTGQVTGYNILLGLVCMNNLCVTECETERRGETQWWMVDDGCDLNKWLQTSQMTSSGGGEMRRGRRITAPSLCVYESLTATKKINNMAATVEYNSHTMPSCLFKHLIKCVQEMTHPSFFEISRWSDYPVLSNKVPWVLWFTCLLYLVAWSQYLCSHILKENKLKGQTRLHLDL